MLLFIRNTKKKYQSSVICPTQILSSHKTTFTHTNASTNMRYLQPRNIQGNFWLSKTDLVSVIKNTARIWFFSFAANKRTNSLSLSLILSSRKGFSDRNCGNFVLMMNIKDACSPRSWLKNSTKKHFNTMNTCLRCLSYRYWLHTIVRLAIKSTMY